MHEQTNPFTKLAERVRQGDTEASAELSKQLEPQMVYMVRRALRERTGSTPFARMVLQEAGHLARNRRVYSAEVAEWLTSQVARNICAAIINRLESGSGTAANVWETVRC